MLAKQVPRRQNAVLFAPVGDFSRVAFCETLAENFRERRAVWLGVRADSRDYVGAQIAARELAVVVFKSVVVGYCAEVFFVFDEVSDGRFVGEDSLD